MKLIKTLLQDRLVSHCKLFEMFLREEIFFFLQYVFKHLEKQLGCSSKGKPFQEFVLSEQLILMILLLVGSNKYDTRNLTKFFVLDMTVEKLITKARWSAYFIFWRELN